MSQVAGSFSTLSSILTRISLFLLPLADLLYFLEVFGEHSRRPVIYFPVVEHLDPLDRRHAVRGFRHPVDSDVIRLEVSPRDPFADSQDKYLRMRLDQEPLSGQLHRLQ